MKLLGTAEEKQGKHPQKENKLLIGIPFIFVPFQQQQKKTKEYKSKSK